MNKGGRKADTSCGGAGNSSSSSLSLWSSSLSSSRLFTLGLRPRQALMWPWLCGTSGQSAFLIAQLVRIYLQLRRSRFDSWVGKICWKRDRLPTPVFLGFPGGSAAKESACSVRDSGSIVHSWIRKIPWRRERLPIPVFGPGEFYGFSLNCKCRCFAERHV